MVTLTISEVINGVEVSDALEGGGDGVDLGSCANNSFAPLVDKSTNNGAQHIYAHHDSVLDPVTNFRVHIQEYGDGTSFTYGGAKTAAQDFTDLKGLGYASGASKNNADGLSGGIWMEMQALVSQANQFDQGARPTEVKIFGDGAGSPTDGIDLASAFLVAAVAMVYDNASVETAGSSPQAGKIGKSGDTVLGDNCHLRKRLYLPDSWPDGGIIQWEVVYTYSYTA